MFLHTCNNTYFNPRTHRGVRPCLPLAIIILSIISIHAPIVGCDKFISYLIDICHLFQSTHPSWGATSISRSIVYFVDILISIHAPIVGCDSLYILSIALSDNFNPRTHRGVRQVEYIKHFQC